jgi:hypothetical protein
MMPLITISQKKLTVMLIIIVLALNSISFIGRTVEYLLGIKETTEFVRLFHIGEEGNITTWYSALSLLFSATLLALITKAKIAVGDPFVRHWKILAIIFVYLSLDEAASIHEISMEPLQAMFNTTGIFYFAWVIIALPLMLLFFIMYFNFLRHLPQPICRLFIVSGVLYVTGALGLELIEGYFWSQESLRWGIIVPMLTTVEEFLEMLGIVIFIFALISYMKSHINLTETRINFI